MACEINASPSNGLVQSADGSGIIKLKSDGKTTNALAWVNFNGTGTVAIRSSYNVSSITDNGTGDYTVNFATALSDSNYAVVGTVGREATGAANILCVNSNLTVPSASSVRIYTGIPHVPGVQFAIPQDVTFANVTIHGN
jgi:hypothetical protein